VYGFSSRNQIYHGNVHPFHIQIDYPNLMEVLYDLLCIGGPTRRQDYWRRKFAAVDWNRQGAIVDLMLDCDVYFDAGSSINSGLFFN
jgi:hypothetical protein